MSILQRLREIADGADDVFIAVDAEGDDGDEAEGEPWVAFYDSCGPSIFESILVQVMLEAAREQRTCRRLTSSRSYDIGRELLHSL